MIAAIPTRYNGTQFRSRLEARWAAFFDQLGWTWEYEPFDLKGWIPDFMLIGRTQRFLVEVKPISQFSPAVAAEMLHASDTTEWEIPLRAGRFEEAPRLIGELSREMLLVGSTLIPRCEHYEGPGLGWFLDKGEVGFSKTPGSQELDLFHTGWMPSRRLAGVWDGIDSDNTPDYRRIERMWRHAGNSVQWRPPH